mmetsp:Transcript_20469/g.52181  ORF Transcript_20469/g.52181 Transcript_20469/m.52181 type:complete len:240 (-) Transcript_20469:2486-3205(-)
MGANSKHRRCRLAPERALHVGHRDRRRHQVRFGRVSRRVHQVALPLPSGLHLLVEPLGDLGHAHALAVVLLGLREELPVLHVAGAQDLRLERRQQQAALLHLILPEGNTTMWAGHAAQRVHVAHLEAPRSAIGRPVKVDDRLAPLLRVGVLHVAVLCVAEAPPLLVQGLDGCSPMGHLTLEVFVAGAVGLERSVAISDADDDGIVLLLEVAELGVVVERLDRVQGLPAGRVGELRLDLP